jgi:outer membrane murein-binding lipoprotein Lpp
MGVFWKRAKVDPAEVIALRDELQTLRVRLDAADLGKEMLEAHVRMLNDTTKMLTTRTSDVDELSARMDEVDELKSQVARIDDVSAKLAALDALNAKIAELADQVTASAVDAKSAKEQAASLNERISNVSTELANQLGELSRDLDELSSRPSAPAGTPVFAVDQTATEEMIEELHEGQVRLAAEQARYEIAFRQDLANLADQIKRPRP